MPRGDTKKYNTYNIPADLEKELVRLRKETGWKMTKCEFLQYLARMGIEAYKAENDRVIIKRKSIKQKHLGCPAYPNCDINQNGCIYEADTEINDVEWYGHRD